MSIDAVLYGYACQYEDDLGNYCTECSVYVDRITGKTACPDHAGMVIRDSRLLGLIRYPIDSRDPPF
jgi:hypothetical protein